MEQLPLKIIQRLSYAPDRYVLHTGVKSLFEECAVLADSATPYRLVFIQGARRSGKTHLAVKLFDSFMLQGRLPHLVDGSEFADWIKTRNSSNLNWDKDEILIVDDVDHYLRFVTSGESGTFVGLVERIRQSCGKIIFLSSDGIESLPCDDHVKSRLRAGSGLHIGVPEDIELPEILREIARQRGVKLPERSVLFLVRRLGREVGALERYLERLLHLSQVLGRSIKFPLVHDAL